MTAVVQVWLDGPDVYVSDVTGTPRPVATDHARTLADRANQSDDGLTKYGPDWFHRDALTSAAELVESLEPCEQCGEAPGTQHIGDGLMFCPGCCSAAQGSTYDDRIEF